METITIEKKVLIDMIEDLQLMKESLELMSDSDAMEGHKRAKQQIQDRDFGEWDEL
jgi:hypothetical protein